MARPMTFESIPAQRNIARILSALEERPRTQPEVAEVVHLTVRSLWAYTKHLHETGQVYISGWTRKPVCGLRATLRPVYAAGPGKDARRPPPQSNVQVQRNVRKRRKADPDTYAESLRKEKARYALRKHEERLERTKRLMAAGYGTPGAVVRNARMGSIRRTPTPDQIAEVIRLRDQGATWKRISEEVGTSIYSARHYYHRVTRE